MTSVDSVEIEAKLLVPDRHVHDELCRVPGMAGFAVEPGSPVVVLDTYLDTRARALLAAGWACRRREQPGRILVTVKGISSAAHGGAGGFAEGVHRRRELEVELAADAAPALWPASPARDTVIGLIGNEPLAVLFRIYQERMTGRVLDGARLVAVVSLDDVKVEREAGGESWMEMEIELAPTGKERDLAALSAWARARFGLVPSLTSKFERALAETR